MSSTHVPDKNMSNKEAVLVIVAASIAIFFAGVHLLNKRDGQIVVETKTMASSDSQARKLPLECSESVMSPKAHGTCAAPVQDNLREFLVVEL